MRWPAAILFAAACAVGCRSTSSTFDPFLPNRRVPAPGTGAASGAPDAYYNNAAPPYGGGAPAYQAPMYQGPPPPGYQQGSPTPAPVNGGFSTVPGPTQTSQDSPPAAQSTRFAKASYVRTSDDEPSAVYEGRRPSVSTTASNDDAQRGGSRVSRPSFGVSSAKGSSSEPIDIMDLPPAVASR